jgi:NAD(P)-dependent dehydrogenase (short-subunit alcohol dehydrogenase family)
MSITDLFSLSGQVALVTGARRGIGRAIATLFAEASADVAVCDINAEDGELNSTVETIVNSGRRGLAVQADVSKNEQVLAMVDKVQNELGPLDILVNNAAFTDMSSLSNFDEYWDRAIDVNLNGCKICSIAVSDGMIERKKGNIINIASVAGFRGEDAGMKILTDSRKASGQMPDTLLKAMMPRPYNVSKAAIIMLTRVLAKQLAPHIRVNAVAPGVTKTDSVQSVISQPELLKKWEAEIPMGRMAELSEIASAVLFLASDAASYVTGHTLIADGGFLA